MINSMPDDTVGIGSMEEEIELQPDDFSLTNEMMTLFKTRRLPAFYTGEK